MDAISWILLAIVGSALVVVGISASGRFGHRSDPGDAIADAKLAEEYDRYHTSAVEMEDRMNGPRTGSF